MMFIRALMLAIPISLAIVYGVRAEDQDNVVDTPEDVQSTSEAAIESGISDESSSYMSGGGFDTGTDTSGVEMTAATFSPLRWLSRRTSR
jgi:hypothetical protein